MPDDDYLRRRTRAIRVIALTLAIALAVLLADRFFALILGDL